MVKDNWKQKGYVDEPVPQGVDLKAEIRRMCKEKMRSSWHTITPKACFKTLPTL